MPSSKKQTHTGNKPSKKVASLTTSTLFGILALMVLLSATLCVIFIKPETTALVCGCIGLLLFTTCAICLSRCQRKYPEHIHK